MSPLPYQHDLLPRRIMPLAVRQDLGGSISDATSANAGSAQIVIQVLCVTFAGISFCSAIVAFYWFRRMRRSFYHDLIMFLIQCDLFKAVGFVIAPIYAFVIGPVQNSSTFCQVDGFIISLGVEASDVAVLMIAIHSAFSIFQPATTAGVGGLYPYRHVAFIIWIVFPVLMASLAFVNPQSAYVAAGTSCYLPVKPIWYSLALSWIPRYIIFLMILGIYLSIYFYVHRKLSGFGRSSNAESSLGPDSLGSRRRSDRFLRPMKHRRPPPTPPLAYHGLIPETIHGSLSQTEARKMSASTFGSYKLSPKIARRPTLLRSLTNRFYGNQDQSSADDLSLPHTMFGPISGAPISVSDPEAWPQAQSSPNIPSTPTSWTTFASRYTGRMPSILDFVSFLRGQSRHPSASSWSSTPIHRLEVMNSRGQHVDPGDIARDRLRRQLRLLFVYPLIYVGLWLIPFVGSIIRYNQPNERTPTVISVLVNTVMTIHCAVDCFVFSIRERPWRHIPGSKGGFWESLAIWRIAEGNLSRQQSWPGKSRAEMAVEARAAYRRRDQEIAARMSKAEQSTRVTATERSWWDVGPGIDGMMSPVIEEIDPFDLGESSP